ncbi:MAG: hypothetical protein LUP94_00850 [Candidatus Methanomethylicus sp.]|nr:hypothetical protein [Candidatus Methanomethylicus sp.]
MGCIEATMQYVDEGDNWDRRLMFISTLAKSHDVNVTVERKCFEGESYYSLVISANNVRSLRGFVSKLMSTIGVPDSPLFCVYAKCRRPCMSKLIKSPLNLTTQAMNEWVRGIPT